MILINKCFSETTPESAENGETSDSGFVFESVPHSFRELVHLMREHIEASQHPARGDVFEWYSSGLSVDDYATATESETSIHFARENEPRAAKYWKKAAIVAGIVKAGAVS